VQPGEGLMGTVRGRENECNRGKTWYTSMQCMHTTSMTIRHDTRAGVGWGGNSDKIGGGHDDGV